MWLTAGYEVNGTVLWSQPELVLYDRNRTKGHGYPDLITDTTTGAVYITEAYKWKPYAEAKTHPVPPSLIAALYSQPTVRTVASSGLVISFTAPAVAIPAGSLPNFSQYPCERYGLTIDLWVHPLPSTSALTVLFDATTKADGAWGVKLVAWGNGTHQISMTDTSGRVASWSTDPTCSARLTAAGAHHIAVVADGGPKMVIFLVDGRVRARSHMLPRPPARLA